MDFFQLQLKFHWNLFPNVNSTNEEVFVQLRLAPNGRQAIILTIGGLAYWRMYASLGLDKLIKYAEVTPWQQTWSGFSVMKIPSVFM